MQVPKILSDDVPMRALTRETQLTEQLVEVPTIVSWSLLRSRTSTFQFLVVEGDLLVFKVSPLNRVQQRSLLLRSAFLSRLWSRTLISPLVEGSKFFSQDTVHLHLLHLQLMFMKTQMSLWKGFFALFHIKKVRSWARTRGRNCSPSPAHPRRLLMWTRCLGWSFWSSSSSSLTRLCADEDVRKGFSSDIDWLTASSPTRGFVFNNLRPGPTRLQETTMVQGDGFW